jgi:hypothetical protein
MGMLRQLPLSPHVSRRSRSRLIFKAIGIEIVEQMEALGDGLSASLGLEIDLSGRDLDPVVVAQARAANSHQAKDFFPSFTAFSEGAAWFGFESRGF